MKQQPNFSASQEPAPPKIPIFLQKRLNKLKALCTIAWITLGNVLLLIGGDDTVEINFNLDTPPIVVPVLTITNRHQ